MRTQQVFDYYSKLFEDLELQAVRERKNLGLHVATEYTIVPQILPEKNYAGAYNHSNRVIEISIPSFINKSLSEQILPINDFVNTNIECHEQVGISLIDLCRKMNSKIPRLSESANRESARDLLKKIFTHYEEYGINMNKYFDSLPVPLDSNVIDVVRHELSHASMPEIYHQQLRIQEHKLLTHYLTNEYADETITEIKESYLNNFDTSFLLRTIDEICAYVFSVTKINTIPSQKVPYLEYKVDDILVDSYRKVWEKQLFSRRFIEMASENTIPLLNRKNVYLEVLSEDTAGLSSYAQKIRKKTIDDISVFSSQRINALKRICDLYVNDSFSLYTELLNPYEELLL